MISEIDVPAHCMGEIENYWLDLYGARTLYSFDGNFQETAFNTSCLETSRADHCRVTQALPQNGRLSSPCARGLRCVSYAGDINSSVLEHPLPLDALNVSKLGTFTASGKVQPASAKISFNFTARFKTVCEVRPLANHHSHWCDALSVEVPAE
jgi:hypothetical protein